MFKMTPSKMMAHTYAVFGSCKDMIISLMGVTKSCIPWAGETLARFTLPVNVKLESRYTCGSSPLLVSISLPPPSSLHPISHGPRIATCVWLTKKVGTLYYRLQSK